MKLRELYERAQLLAVRCSECRAEMVLDPLKAGRTHGAETDLSGLSIPCPSCGSHETRLEPWVSRAASTEKA